MGKFATVESGIDNEIGSWKGSTSGRKQNLYWTGERVLWDMLIESKSDIRQLLIKIEVESERVWWNRLTGSDWHTVWR